MRSPSRGGARARRETGASLVELAIAAPVVLFIVFGILDLAFVFRSASVTTASTRAGARVAASNYGDTETGPERIAVRDAIAASATTTIDDLAGAATPIRLLIYRANAAGQPDSGTTDVCGANCMRFTWDPVGKAFVWASGTWDAPDNCGVVLDRVGVFVEATHRLLAGTLGPSITVEERTVMRLEPGLKTCTIE